MQPKPKKEKEVTELVNKIVSGSATIKHGSKYGTFNIDEFGKTITQIKNDEVRIYGSWVTMSADIQDGYVLVIPNGQDLLFDGKEPKQQQICYFVKMMIDDVSPVSSLLHCVMIMYIWNYDYIMQY